MRNTNLLLYAVAVLFALLSCKSNEELIYLQNLPYGEVETADPFSVTDYRLKKGDNLYVQVKSIDPEVTQLFNPMVGGGYAAGTSQQFGTQSSIYINGYQLDSEGNIELPVVGLVYVEGKTLEESKKLLMQRVSEFFKQATVTVKLLSFKFTVMGEVARPGVFYNYNDDCTILEAISQANGTTDYAKLKNVLVLRRSPDGNKSIAVDLSDKSLIYSEAYYLRPNDVIYVSPDRYKNTRLNSSLYALALSSASTLIVILKFLGD